MLSFSTNRFFFSWWGVNDNFYCRYLEYSTLTLGDMEKSAKTSVVSKLFNKSQSIFTVIHATFSLSLSLTFLLEFFDFLQCFRRNVFFTLILHFICFIIVWRDQKIVSVSKGWVAFQKKNISPSFAIAFQFIFPKFAASS
jgi:hypothetical protein